MALLIEDGNGVTGANSYVTLDQIKAFAVARGYVLPATDAAIEVLAVKAKDHLEAQRARYKGNKLYGLGFLQWPRSGVRVDGFEIAENVIPDELKNAQCQLCVDLQIADTVATAPNTAGLVVKREKIDVLETEYFSPNEAVPMATSAVMPKVDAFLEPLFKWIGLRVDRA